MKRASIVAAAGLGLTLLLLTFPGGQPDTFREDAEEVATGTTSGDVQVEHQFVTAEIIHEPAPAGSVTASHPRPVPAARTSQQRQPANPGLLQRARRVLVGDGRHRPEPFPRIRQE